MICALPPSISNLKFQDSSHFIVLDFLSPPGKHSMCTLHLSRYDSFQVCKYKYSNIVLSPCTVTRCAEMSDAKQYKKALYHLLVEA